METERSPSRVTTTFDSATERRICSMPSMVSRTARMPRSAALAAASASSYERAALVSTCAIDALISVMEAEVSVANLAR